MIFTARLGPRRGLAAACWLLLGMLLPVRGDLVLTNFSRQNPVHPIKVMAIGDSITDDCVVNGAWRAPLESLLNKLTGFRFTYIGRQLSPAGSGFNFVPGAHEGYCGAVIAPPGVLTSPVHGYAGTNVYLLNIIRDALTNAVPDLVLVLMGANDIGRGRDPYHVATNDMAQLLDLIFSNAPNANIILAKTTTLQNALVGTLDYGAYATNVPIYNAALQALVNRRHALGQNVFLADMFSAVDYSTMFNSDHLHPNAAGLTAIANEWAARVQAILIRTNQTTTTLIHGGDNWKYSDAGQDPGPNWAQAGYDDGAWSNGIARLGYGDPAVATTVGFGADADNKNITTWFRRSFVVPPTVGFTNLNFRLSAVDGAAIWLNGAQVFRTNLPAGPLADTNRALTLVTGNQATVFCPTNLTVPGLPAGTNLVAVELHKSSPANAALGFDLELIGTGYRIPVPSLSLAPAGGNLLLSWPATNGAGYTLYSTIRLAAGDGWIPAAALLQTNGGQISTTLSPDATTRFYRLQSP